MSKKDLFRSPFDEGTMVKLKIFEDYFKEWLPVFIAKEKPIWNEIQIFDFFAGEGKDINGAYGSPMRILTILNDNREHIIRNKIKVNVIVNEFEKAKYNLLIENINSIADRSLYNVDSYNDDFKDIFARYYDSMRKTANFLFLDQNGIKQITEDVFSKLIQLEQTDLLFFISSSYIKRFAEIEEFSRYLKITKQDFENQDYYHIHRIVLNYYRNLIPTTKKYYLAPFSIKKPAGIYGLIFGTNHPYGLEKFLNVCWKHDGLTGEANFDIDNEKINSSSPTLFPELNIPSKRQLFEENLKSRILDRVLNSNIDVYMFTLEEGFLPRDANIILKDLRQSSKISFDFKLASSKVHKQDLSQIKIS